jgi:glycogen phosphorylase
MANVITLPSAVEGFYERVNRCLRHDLCKRREEATAYDVYRAMSLAVRESLMEGLFQTQDRYEARDAKRLYYLSLEFLIGRSLGSNILNLGLMDICREVARQLGYELEQVFESEPDAALGNGGLGRLAACFLDSLATLDMPAYGYGINYDYGLFRQEIDNGHQREKPDQWLSEESPWTIERSDRTVIIPVYGTIAEAVDRSGNYNPMWMEWKVILGVPHDVLIPGYGGRTVNMLRLYSARSSQEFDMKIFNQGDYISAVQQKISSETISKVLYPSDDVRAGRELRLLQEYFLVGCALRDIMRRFQRKHDNFESLPDHVAIQLNDTHPALTVAELMRMLIDEHDVAWEKAWEITQATCAYTNHTLLPEALERWPVSLMHKVLPRHLQLIYEINERFMRKLTARWPGDVDRMRRMSIIEEGPEKQVRMAYLSILGSHSVNGVAELHSHLVTKTLVPDFYEYVPEKFNNKTNGVTHRRWLLLANPELSSLITSCIGDGWRTDLEKIRRLEEFAGDPEVQREFLRVKRQNKERLADHIHDQMRVLVSPDSLFDVHVKRIHEYKRQLLNVMHVIHRYLCIVEDGVRLPVPRTYILAGKAAPGYFMAKLIIKLINNVAEEVNNDPRVQGQMKVLFLPDYKVSLAEKIMPAADLSEQISTAGKEASGTGNMKLAMNGALTIGTLDGANIEILEEVGQENIYIFGLKAEEVLDLQRRGAYNPWDYYNRSHDIRRVVDAIRGDSFCVPQETGIFKPIFDSLMYGGDPYFHLADLEPLIEAQNRADADFRDRGEWARRALLNVARMGKFSSDRTIRQYATEIWKLKPVV